MTITSEFRWLEDYPAPDALPADDPRGFLAVILTIWHQLAQRCALVLPDLDVSRSLPYVLALHWHSWAADDESFAALLASEPYQERANADDVLHAGTVHQPAPDYGWLEPASAMSRVPDRASHKRADGTVRGRDLTYVVGADGDGRYVKMPAGEILARADMWNRATGHTVPDLIGTDTTSWAQVVTFSPDSATVHTAAGNEVRYVFAPDRRPGEVSVGDGRKRRGHRARTAQYAPRPELEYLSWAHFLATGQRVIKRYRTRFLVTVTRDGDTVRNTRWTWDGIARSHRTVTISRTKSKGTGRTIERPTPCTVDTLRDHLTAAFKSTELPSRYVITRADGTRVTATVDRKNRRYCLNVKHADGSTARRNARTIDAAMANAATL